MLRHNAGKLMNRKVIVSPLRRIERHIVALDHRGKGFKLTAAPSDIVEIKDRAIVFGAEVYADDPLHERITDLSHLIENESQEISGLD